MAQRKKEHPSCRRAECGGSRSHLVLQVSGSITRIFAGGPTSTSDNTGGRLVEFTSNLRASRETMTARSFSFSKNLNHRSVKAGTWLRIFLFLSCGSKNWKRAANLR